MSRRIAILGATSQIAKNLIVRFGPDDELFLFCRNAAAMNAFLESERPKAPGTVLPFDSFPTGTYDAVINCVGIADPRKQKADPYQSFSVTERFDDMALDYLRSHAGTRYINFSSGAVFGAEFPEPVVEGSTATFCPNNLKPADCYRIAKLNAEAKHRCLSDLAIVDIRVFSFFSRYIDLNAGFLLSEIARCLLEKRPFRTNSEDIVRDYISPDDLFRLVERVLESPPANAAVDAVSAAPVRKFELLDAMEKEFGLVVEVSGDTGHTVSGKKSEYYSKNGAAAQVLGFISQRTSLESVKYEIAAICISLYRS